MSLSCQLKFQDFPGDTYIEHTRCITEDEKYGGKNYQAKANANKGLKKQNAWIENLQVWFTEPLQFSPKINSFQITQGLGGKLELFGSS